MVLAVTGVVMMRPPCSARLARFLLSRTMSEPDGPLGFFASGADPFSSRLLSGLSGGSFLLPMMGLLFLVLLVEGACVLDAAILGEEGVGILRIDTPLKISERVAIELHHFRLPKFLVGQAILGRALDVLPRILA